MSNIEGLIKSSKVTIIIGDGKSGKNTFALYIIKKILQEDCIVISSIESSLYKRKISIAQKNFKDFTYIGQDLHYFLLKDNYISLKRAYSYDFLEEELRRIIEKSDIPIIYINRFEEFFEHQDRHDIEPLFKAILQYVKENEKHIIMAISSNAYHFDFIYPMLEDYADLIINIEEETLSRRLVEIKYSIESTDVYNYVFYSKNRELFLEENRQNKNYTPSVINADLIQTRMIKEEDGGATLGTKRVKKKKNKASVVIISTNRELINLHTYLFKKSDLYELSIIQNDPFKALKKALENPEVIIYNPINENLELDICKTVKENELDSRILYIQQKDFVRQSDRSKAFDAGCHELFSDRFNFEEYLLSLKKSLNTGFYSKRFEKLVARAKSYDDKVEFEKEVKLYLEQRVFFTIFNYSFKGENEDLLEELNGFMREYDRAYVNFEKKRITYLAINTRRYLGTAIGNRLKSLDSTIEYKGAKDATSLIKLD